MAERHAVAGSIAPLLVFAGVLTGVLPLLVFAVSEGGFVAPDAYVWRATRFTLWQAALSTLLSVVPAVLVARALVRRSFPGKRLLLALFAVPLSLPVIAAVLGIVQVFGAAGWLGGWFTLYGLQGILIAHVFFNLPLAIRLLLEALQTIPAESQRLSAQLGFGEGETFRHVDWPVLAPALTRAAALIFLLCASSFVIVLTLGGGPQATTLEVAIYQSLRMDFDAARAVTLSLVQAGVSIVLVYLLGWPRLQAPTHHMLRLAVRRHDGAHTVWRALDCLAIGGTAVLVALPLIAVVAAGLSGLVLNALTLKALLTSIAMAFPSAFISVALSFALARHASPFATVASLLAWIVPPAVIATGWFLAFGGWNGGVVLAAILIVVLNALMALPFGVSALAPAVARLAKDHAKLCTQLGIAGWTRLRVIDLPAVKRPLGQAILMAFVLSLGDLTAVTLLGSQGLVTLPSLVAQQMGSYRGTQAGGTALLLAAMCYGLTLLSQRLDET